MQQTSFQFLNSENTCQKTLGNLIEYKKSIQRINREFLFFKHNMIKDIL